MGVLQKKQAKHFNSKHLADLPNREQTTPERTQKERAGCKPDASNPALSGIPNALFLAWPNTPEHIRFAILSLVAPYLPPSDDR